MHQVQVTATEAVNNAAAGLRQDYRRNQKEGQDSLGTGQKSHQPA